MKNKNKKVLVAISGGVDSAVASKILLDQGYDLSAIFLNFWKDDDSSSENKCCSLKSQQDARDVCRELSIPFYTLDLSIKFKNKVVDNFLKEYSDGKTPNPCVVCNREIKIGGLLKYAENMGFDYLATGHYARIIKEGDKLKMLRAKDKSKDQSYFLYTLKQEQLSKLLFPLGGIEKSEVRKIAEKSDLGVSRKADSQEICFISGKRHNDFLKKYLKLKKGKIVLWPSGEILGEHQGLALYTIGQRRGVEIGGTGPYYVAKFDRIKNILYVVKNFDDPLLYQSEMKIKDLSWTNMPEKSFSLGLSVVIRYQHKAVDCSIDYNSRKNIAKVVFREKQRAVTPGQSAVFYQGEELLGGGIII
jgi:tRNA-uridine 2-sulfurtransferase